VLDQANRPLILLAPHFVGPTRPRCAFNTLVRGVFNYAQAEQRRLGRAAARRPAAPSTTRC